MYTQNFCDSYQRKWCGHVRSVLKRHQCMLVQSFVLKLNFAMYTLCTLYYNVYMLFFSLPFGPYVLFLRPSHWHKLLLKVFAMPLSFSACLPLPLDLFVVVFYFQSLCVGAFQLSLFATSIDYVLFHFFLCVYACRSVLNTFLEHSCFANQNW